MAKLGLMLHKIADTSAGERVTRYDPLTGIGYLTDPRVWDPTDPDTWVEIPWPLAGVEIEGTPPERTEFPTRWVARGESEGWLELEGVRVVERPGGPPEAPWEVRHVFVHADAIVLKCVAGDVRYRVLENPDKWPETKSEDPSYPDGLGFGGEVSWAYDVELES